MKMLSNLRDSLLSLIFPQQCHVCGALVESWSDGAACAVCWEKAQLFTDSLCPSCGLPLNKSSSIAPVTHRDCCDGLDYAVARSCGAYDGALRATVLYLKTHPYICSHLKAILRKTFEFSRSALESDLIIPVPLHPLRLKERGFNQAELLARSLSKAAGCQVDAQSLIRIKNTEKHRAGMDAYDRAKSVENAFKVNRPGAIKGAVVLLIDDVYTSGATLSSCSKALLEAGAKQVNVLTVARAIGSR